MLRGYRICNFNDAAHEGVHAHPSLTGPATFPIPVLSQEDAVQIVRNYAIKYDSFNRTRLEAQVKAWKSK